MKLVKKTEMTGRLIAIYGMIGVILAPVSKFISTYIFSDWTYLEFLFVIIGVDTVLGLYKAWIQHNISSKAFGMLIKKFIIYSAALICAFVVVNFKVGGNTEGFFSWVDDAVYSALICREAISIFENIAIIDPGVIPAWILKRLKQFDSWTGKPLENKDDKTK